MEREPEEDHHAEHCEEGGHALLDFLGHCAALLVGDADILGLGFLAGGGEVFLDADEDQERYEHGADRGDERVVDACVEDVEILRAEGLDVACGVASGLGDEGIEVVEVLGAHRVGDAEIFMAESGELGIVGQ